MELLDKFRAVQERARRQNIQYSNKAPGSGSNGVANVSTYTPPRVPTPSGQTVGNAPVANSKTRGGLGIARLAGARKGIGRGR